MNEIEKAFSEAAGNDVQYLGHEVYDAPNGVDGLSEPRKNVEVRFLIPRINKTGRAGAVLSDFGTEIAAAIVCGERAKGYAEFKLKQAAS